MMNTLIWCVYACDESRHEIHIYPWWKQLAVYVIVIIQYKVARCKQLNIKQTLILQIKAPSFIQIEHCQWCQFSLPFPELEYQKEMESVWNISHKMCLLQIFSQTSDNFNTNIDAFADSIVARIHSLTKAKRGWGDMVVGRMWDKTDSCIKTKRGWGVLLHSLCFESSQPLRIISGLMMNFSSSLNYTASK